MRTRVLPCGFLALFVSAPLTLAQDRAEIVLPNETQGMLTGVAVGTQLVKPGPTPGSLDERRLRVRTPGHVSGGNVPWSAGTFGNPEISHPDYSAFALFNRWTTTIAGSTVSWNPSNPLHIPILGDMSTGGDQTPRVDADGQLDMTAPSTVAWYSLSFTVGSATTGLPNSVFQNPSLGNPAGNVFSYTAIGSTQISASFEDTLRFEYTRSQMGLNAASETETEISALDWGIGVISTSANGLAGRILRVRNLFFFTLDRDWWWNYGQSQGVNFTFLGGGGTQVELDPSVVYAMRWDGSVWSRPVVALDANLLYGGAQPVDELSGPAIDGLSVHMTDESWDPILEPLTSALAPEWRVVFSLDGASTLQETANPGNTVAPPSELLVSQGGGSALDVQAAVLRVEAPVAGALGTPVTEKIGIEEPGLGIGPNKIRGLCGVDPKEGENQDRYIGIAFDEIGSDDPPELGLSVQHFDAVLGPGSLEQSLMLGVSGLDAGSQAIPILAIEWQFVAPGSLDPELLVPFVPEGGANPFVYVLQPGQTDLDQIFEIGPTAGLEMRWRATQLGLALNGALVVDGQSWVSVLTL